MPAPTSFRDTGAITHDVDVLWQTAASEPSASTGG